MFAFLRRRLSDETGLGMILVIGIMVFVAGLTVTAGTIAKNGLGQSRQRINFESALTAAESGVDFALGHLQYAFDQAYADYPIPNPGSAPDADCTAGVEQLPDLGATDEQAWALGRLTALVEAHPECLITTSAGQAMVLKPTNAVGDPGVKYGRVYAMGWAPAYGAARAVSRAIKVEYVFMPYSPEKAILTGASLTLKSTSTDVMVANGVDPEAAGVHTNGDLTVIGQPTVTGDVSFTGTATGSFDNFKDDTANPTDEIPIPWISARAFYRQADSIEDATLPGKWVDLCPDGKVRDYGGGAGPCTGAESGKASDLGWSWKSSTRTWTATKDAAPRTYYVHEADVANGTGNGAIENITVIASAEHADDCGAKRYGNIVWDHYDTPAPSFPNLFFLADGDLSATSNFYSGQSAPGNVISGMYVAGEEVLVWTSSSGLVGSVLAGNQCASDSGPVASNEVQGQIIKFDPKGESPFSTVIATTLWLEY